MLKYPPFTDIIVISVIADTNSEAKKVITDIYKLLDKTKIKDDIQIFEPQVYRINKLQNKYRWKIILKTNFDNQISYWIRKVISYIKTPKGSIVIVDLNPYNI